LKITFTPVNTAEQSVGSPTTHTLTEWLTPTSLGEPNILHGTSTVNTQEYQMDVTLDKNITTSNSTITFDLIFTGTQIEVAPTATP